MRRFLALACILICLPAAVLHAREDAVVPAKPLTTGVYTDRDSVKHRWYVNHAHTLIWDRKPYLPVGGMYCPPYTWEQNEGGWTLTKAQLDMLKSKGVIDLYIHFAMSCPPENLQRTIDYLEELGFRYGLELTSGPESGRGYSIQRAGTKVESVTASGTYGVEVADPLGGIYLLVDEETGQVVKVGKARVYEHEEPTGKTLESGEPEVAKKQGLEADVECAPGRKLGLRFTPLVNGGQPYFWNGGFHAYKERLLNHCREVKFGKGFRFVVDPLHKEMNVSHNFLPSSPDYVRQFARWLLVRYRKIDRLNEAWAMTEGSALPDFETAGRLVPLRVLTSKQPRAPAEVGVLYDPQKDRVYTEDASCSQIWYDMMDFSGEVYGRYCSAVSEAFKNEIADVPIVFKHAGPIGRYRINPDEAGFDGIGMEPYGVGETLLPMNAAVCYSEVEQSAKTMWLLVTEFSQAAFDFQLENIGHMDRESMYADMSALLGAGAKGIFVFALGFGPWAEGQFWMSEFLRDPRQLEWMATFRRIVESSAKLVDYRPTYYYRYPAQRQEKFTFGPLGSDFAGIDGDWTGHNGSAARAVARAPDGTWVLPTWSCSIDTPLIIANLRSPPASLRYGPALEELIRNGAPLVTYVGFRQDLGVIPALDKYFTDQFAQDDDGTRIQVLQPSKTGDVLARTGNGHVWNLVEGSLQIISKEVADKEGWQPEGLRIPRVDQFHEPERFLAEVLGVKEFKLEPDIHGFTFRDGRKPITYLWSDRMTSSIRLDPGLTKRASARYANGDKAGQRAKDGSLIVQPPLKKQPETTEEAAPYIRGRHCATENWQEALVLEGVPVGQVFSPEEFLPAYRNPVLPPNIWIEGEDFLDSNFNVGKYSGMTKLSGRALWGLDTFVDPASDGYCVKYRFRSAKAGVLDLWAREWVGKSPCRWRVNRGKWNDAPEGMEEFGRRFCGPWALFDDSKIVFAWFKYGQARLHRGRNTLEIRVTEKRGKGDKYCKFFDALAFTLSGTNPWELASDQKF